MEDKLIQILITGGTTSGMLMAIWALFKIVSNHLEHNNQAMKELSVAIAKLTQVIEDKL